jgi:transposase
MESTGVYWISLYELLVERGFEVLLVDARQAKNVIYPHIPRACRPSFSQ